MQCVGVIILGVSDNFNLRLLFANVSNVNIPVSSKKPSSFPPSFQPVREIDRKNFPNLISS